MRFEGNQCDFPSQDIWHTRAVQCIKILPEILRYCEYCYGKYVSISLLKLIIGVTN